MGLFLAMSGVVGAKSDAVEQALSLFVDSHRGSFNRSTRSSDAPNTLVLLGDNLRSSVLYPWGFLRWDEASQYLSLQLKCPVFSFHIHDEDLWMFVLFDKGKQVAQFNPVPEYWDDSISEQERSWWSGDAEAIASHLPGVSADSVRPYLRHWDLEDENPGKAFPEDQFSFQDCWQLCDFMKKLGLKYPLDDCGNILGETYEFIIPQDKA